MTVNINDENNVNVSTEAELIAQRRAKLTKLREKGIAFPNQFRRDSLAANLHQQYNELSDEQLTEGKHFVRVAGRIMLRRVMGKASFIQIQDMSGQIQLYIREQALGVEAYDDFKKWDMGDIIGAEGYLFKTKTGELSIKVEALLLLTKSLKPLPDKFHGLTDQEMRYRQRYVDLIVNVETRKTFHLRSKLIQSIRDFLIQREFLEVETPMMHTIPGGATARPFITYHNALDMELYLRVAPELYLKRLVVGGFEKVFEINRNFRNEGLSTRHNPEFTMLEFYQAYADYEDLMNLTETLFQYLIQTLCQTSILTYQGQEIDFGKPFERLTIIDAIIKYNPSYTREALNHIDTARSIAENLSIPLKSTDGLGKIQLEIFEKTVEHQLKDPTFITAYPAEVSPLARRNDKNPFIVDRFELFIAGREIANGFSELNDAEDQAARFKEQVNAKNAGDQEAMHYDDDYIHALEYGLPPTAGEGIGIDRLAMLFTDSPSIRDVLLFPHMRPQA
ncbi:MAG: Lysine--tRNA ligase, heat inducible [Legionellaceae bacterium]